jgi:gliding motility associated protien GldN
MRIISSLLLLLFLITTSTNVVAQKKKKAVKKTTKTKSKAKIQSTTPVGDTAVASIAPTPAPEVKPNDSLPIKPVKKSLRPDEAVETAVLRDRTPLAYEHIRADDAVYRHRIWREIDIREKFNHTFKYAADADNGNQRFFSILLSALQDSTKEITAFNSIDDRFTTPLTRAELVKACSGPEVDVPIFDSLGNQIGSSKKLNELSFDSIYRFRIKEEVIFDKESSRLFWRILGICPVMNLITSQGVVMDDPTELFWIYYPDIRPILATYEVYNGKNFGGRMSWEELFESRMFSGRIIKSSYDNPLDLRIKDIPGLNSNKILQLFEGENIKEKIFTYEQDLWSY